MRRSLIRVMLPLALGLLWAARTTEVQPPHKMPRIGLLCPTICGGPALEGLLQGLHDTGYREGQNLLLESRQAEGRFERLPDLTAELAHLYVDGAFDRRELLRRVAFVTGSIAAATMALESVGLPALAAVHECD